MLKLNITNMLQHFLVTPFFLVIANLILSWLVSLLHPSSRSFNHLNHNHNCFHTKRRNLKPAAAARRSIGTTNNSNINGNNNNKKIATTD